MFSKIINGEKFRYVNSRKGFTAYRKALTSEEVVLDGEDNVVSTDIKTFWSGL